MGDDPVTSGSDLPAVSGSYPGPALDAQHFHGQGTSDNAPQAYLQQSYNIPHQGLNVNFDMSQPQVPMRSGPYNMADLANALPQTNYRQGHFNPAQVRYGASASSPNVVGQNQQMPQYNGQPAMGHLPNHSYYMQQQPQLSPYYSSPLSPSQQQSNMSPRLNMPYYGGLTNSHPSMAYYYTHMPPYAPQGQFAQGMSGAYVTGAGPQHDPRLGPSQPGEIAEGVVFSPTQQEMRQSPTDSQSNVVRGPPRKPRQTGHALWIGNLPSQTNLMSLVHHVCKEAEGLESLFLISKSNCAFANYTDEATCLAAQQKLHESKFQSVRLVSRLRKNTVEGASGVTAPTGPAGTSPQPPTSDSKQVAITEAKEVHTRGSETATSPTTSSSEVQAPPVIDVAAQQKDKFFILKSLTLEDLELSVRTGIWATQSHNEETLNTAFKSSENVYLVFSANKSGEYFGYARMVSTINEDPAAAVEFAPKTQSVSDVDLPKEIPTEPTEFTPKGRIIDDSARGTIFWESVRDENTEAQEADETTPTVADQDDASSGPDNGGPESKTWGKPFKLEWLCTNRLPFYRCRGLRNPWNSNREVKIARDGTELEPSTGRRLIGLFNRNHNSPAPRGLMMGIGQMMPQQQQVMQLGYATPYQ